VGNVISRVLRVFYTVWKVTSLYTLGRSLGVTVAIGRGGGWGVRSRGWGVRGGVVNGQGSPEHTGREYRESCNQFRDHDGWL